MRRIALFALTIALAGVLLATAQAGAPTFEWQLTPTGSAARLRGLSAVSKNVAWASGSLGTVLRTVDGGDTWQSVGPPGTSALQFRDIEAFDANRAVILSIGTGTDSRIYTTSDGGANWDLAFQNEDPNAFYDCMAFFDSKNGLALSDPVDGFFRILATSDGGASWDVVDADMPAALAGEFAFAASGQCLVAFGGKHAWIGTGGGAESRVFRTTDRGLTWDVSTTPIPSGPTAGIYALAMRSPRHGFAVGNDFLVPDSNPDNLALTGDGGVNWALADEVPGEYRSGATWVNGRIAIVVGPTGSHVSLDMGLTWQPFDDGSFDTVDCATPVACWASGEQGRVAYLVMGH